MQSCIYARTINVAWLNDNDIVLRLRENLAIRQLFSSSLVFGLIVLAFMSLPGAWKSKFPKGRKPMPLLSVFALDDRQEIDVRGGVFSPIGRIEVRDDGVDPNVPVGNIPICSGVLVWKDLVLTNAHCIVAHQGKAKAVWFRPGYYRGNKGTSARMVERWIGTQTPDQTRGQDWALLRLDRSLGEEVGWFEVAEPDATDGQIVDPLTFVAYGSDFKSGSVPTYQSGCKITGFSLVQSLLRHDCDMNSGSSGAPLLRRLKNGMLQIIGLNAAHTGLEPFSYFPSFSPEKANFAVHPSAFIALLRKIVSPEQTAAESL